MTKSPLAAVGIDVAKASLSVCWQFQNGAAKALSIRNTKTDINKLIVKLSGFTGKIVMEATSYYHWLAALLLSEAGHDVRIVNPLLASKYARSSIRKIKSDPADASALANMALIEQALPQSFTATRQHLVLRKKIGSIAALKSQLQPSKATRKSFQEARSICRQPCTAAERELNLAIKSLTKAIRQLEAEFELEAAALMPPQKLQHFTSVPGVSLHLAVLADHWYSLNLGSSAKAWIGYAGLDVSTRQSGTWRGRTKLTKRGNNYLRRRLYSAAWGAVMHDQRFRDWYDHLRAEGSGHVEALIIIARKLVRILYAIAKHGTEFDHSRPLFQES